MPNYHLIVLTSFGPESHTFEDEATRDTFLRRGLSDAGEWGPLSDILFLDPIPDTVRFHAYTPNLDEYQ